MSVAVVSVGLVHLALHCEPACYCSCNSDTCHDRLLTGAEQAFTDVSSSLSQSHLNFEVTPREQAVSLRAAHKGLVHKIQIAKGLDEVDYD